MAPSSSDSNRIFFKATVLLSRGPALYTTPYVPSPIFAILSYRRKLFGSSVFDVGASEPGLGALGSSAIVILVSGGRLSMVRVDYDTGNVAARGRVDRDSELLVGT